MIVFITLLFCILELAKSKLIKPVFCFTRMKCSRREHYPRLCSSNRVTAGTAGRDQGCGLGQVGAEQSAVESAVTPGSGPSAGRGSRGRTWGRCSGSSTSTGVAQSQSWCCLQLYLNKTIKSLLFIGTKARNEISHEGKPSKIKKIFIENILPDKYVELPMKVQIFRDVFTAMAAVRNRRCKCYFRPPLTGVVAARHLAAGGGGGGRQPGRQTESHRVPGAPTLLTTVCPCMYLRTQCSGPRWRHVRPQRRLKLMSRRN